MVVELGDGTRGCRDVVTYHPEEAHRPPLHTARPPATHQAPTEECSYDLRLPPVLPIPRGHRLQQILEDRREADPREEYAQAEVNVDRNA